MIEKHKRIEEDAENELKKMLMRNMDGQG